MPAPQWLHGGVMPARSDMFLLWFRQDAHGFLNINNLLLFSRLLTQGADFRLQFPDALSFPVVAAGLAQSHPSAIRSVTQGVNANASVPDGLHRLPPLPGSHPCRAGFAAHAIWRRQPPFFVRSLFHGFAPFLSILFTTNYD